MSNMEDEKVKEVNDPVGAKAIKEQFVEARKLELESLNKELAEWLKDNDLDLDAVVESGSRGNNAKVFIVDLL